MPPVVERVFCFMIGSDVMFGAGVGASLQVMSLRGVMMRGRDGMMLRYAEIDRGRDRRRYRVVGRTREITRQWTAIVPGVISAHSLPVFHCPKCMTMRRHRHVRGVCIVLADLIMPRRLTMKMRRLFVM